MFSLKDKVALVTGASQGIGRATALALAQTGARVALAARNETKLAELAAQITATGGEALPVPMDLAQPEQIKSGFESVRAKFGGLHILVNNAAVTRDGLSMRMKPEDWDAVIQVNLTAAHIAIQHALTIMLRQKWGRIINVSSVVAETGNAGQANYVAAKAGLIGLTKAIAVEVASRNITVNAVAPGFIVSPMTDPLSEQVKDALLARIPLRRMGRDQEVAAAIAFLASEEASYITGHVLDVNGGMYMA